MTTSAVSGNSGRITYGGTKIAELKNYTLNPTQNLIDATSTDSAGWEEVIPGRRSWTATGNAFFIDGDTIQQNMMVAELGQTTAAVEFDVVQTSGKTKWTGTVYLSDFKITVAENAAAMFDFTMKGTGALTKGTQ